MFSPKPPGGKRRLLTVEVLEARGLLAVEANGTSDPYAVVSVVLEGRTIDDGLKKTNVIKGTLAPKWKHQVMEFGNSFDLHREGPCLQVQVFDSNTFGKDKELGEVTVHWTPDGLDIQQWYKLQPFGSLHDGANLGEVLIKIKIDEVPPERRGSAFRSGAGATPPAGTAGAAADPGMPRTGSALDREIVGQSNETDELPEHADQAPNLLKIKVVQARGLAIADKNVIGSGGSSDPLVKLVMGTQEFRTKVIKKTLEPVWNETFTFLCSESSESLAVVVEDDDFASNDFLGSINVHMDELKHKKKVVRWYPLGLQDGSKSQESLGDIFLEMQWYYDPASEGKSSSSKSGIFGILRRSVGLEDKADDTEDDGDDGDDAAAGKMNAEQQAAAEKEEEEKRAKLKSQLMDIEVKSGDYVIYVHIIEARDLKGEDVQGTSDPVVYVTAFGQRFATEVKDKCLSAVWDETFVISCRNLDKEEFEQGVIRIAVMDADIGLGGLGTATIKSDLIGAYSFDATFVYSQIDHEIHRKWLALNDDEDPKDGGVQGYLKMSISIVGPGDKLKVHDEEADRIKEREEEAKAGGFDKLVLMPASIDRKQQWLVTTVWKAEYLPKMDETLIGDSGGDYYATMSVAGGKPLKTKRLHITGNRSALNPAWRTELWYPVTMPCASGNIKYAVMDWDTIGDDEVVGSFTGKVKQITDTTGGKLGPRWVPMYGPPLKIPDGANLKALSRKIGGDKVDWNLMYTNFPDKGSMYRGRLLITEEIRSELPSEHDEERLPWKRKVKALNPSLEPATKKYTLACYVATGTELPQFPNVLTAGTQNLPMWLRFSIGKYEIATQPSKNDRGVCVWYEMLELDEIALPADPRQLPDIVVHLMRDTGKDALPVCFVRFKAADLLDDKFVAGPKWVALGEDKVLDFLGDNEFPGSVLMRLGFGLRSTYEARAEAWHKQQEGLSGKKFPYEVRLHVYQCRDLPAADDNGLMDPYLKLSLLGHSISTEDYEDPETKKRVLRRRETTDPTYYFTRRWPTELAPPHLKGWFPQCNIKVFDWDLLGGHDYAGQVFVSLADCEVEDPSKGPIKPPPFPKWVPIFKEKPGDSSGEILLSCQVIAKTSKTQEIPAPPSLVPETRDAWVEALIIGIRGMMPYQMLPMQLPYAEIEMDVGKDEKKVARTEPSHKPTGADANFLQRIKIKMPLPVNEIFAPRAKIRIYDTRLGGFLKPLVGAGRIDLLSKLPWSTSYVPPTANAIDAAALLEAAQAEIEAAEKAAAEKAAAAAAAGTEEAKGGEPLTLGQAANAFAAAAAADKAAPQAAAPANPALAAMAASMAGSSVVKKSSASSGLIRQATLQQLPTGLARTATASKIVAAAGVMDVATATGSSALPYAAGGVAGVTESLGQKDEGLGVMPALLRAAEGSGPAGPIGTAEADVQLRRIEAQLSARVPPASSREGDSGAGATALVGEVSPPPEDEEDDGPPKYMIGRTTLDGELEGELKTTPFETYELWRGSDEDFRVVGKLKCIVRVTVEDPDEVPLFVHVDEYKDAGGLEAAQKENNRILTELLKPKGYKLRLYVLQALNLTPMDVGIGGRPGKSDPYLKVTLGREVFDDCKNYIDDVTDADLYKCVELNAELPGASQLDIAVMDKDDFGGDDVIGRTVIDLEDRWFDQRWQVLGKENRCEPNPDGKPLRWQTKPLEPRSLYVPTSKAPQGVLQCWVDIMSTGDANAFPPDDVALPPTQEFEVRLVVWKCKDVVSMDDITNMNDLFVKAWVEGCDPLETDTHWRAKKGKGSFNWRMKFKVLLGPRTRAWKFPYLTLQMWDRDILKWNDCIAEGMFDLGAAFKKAYKRKQVVKLFTEVSAEAQAKAKKEADMRAIDAANAELDGPPAYDDSAPLLAGDSAAAMPPPPATKGRNVAAGAGVAGLTAAGADSSSSTTAYNMGRVASPPSSSPTSFSVGGSSTAATAAPARPLSSRPAAPSPGDPLARPAGNLSAPLVPVGPRSDTDSSSSIHGHQANKLFPPSKPAAQHALGGGAAAPAPSSPRAAASVGSPRSAAGAAGGSGGGSVADRLTDWLFVQDPPPRRPAGPGSPGSTGAAAARPPAAAGAAGALPVSTAPGGAVPQQPPRKRAVNGKKGGKGGAAAAKKKDPNAKTATELERENDRRKALGLPEVTAADYKTTEGGEDQEAKEFIRSIKEMAGLSDGDPMETQWLHMERTNRKTGKKEPMGKCCIGIQIWPVEKAAVQAVGFGRSEPNNTPYLPPPTGRLKFSFNPFVMGTELFGPKICCYIMCACCCILVILLLIFCQPVFNLAIAVAFSGN